MHRTQPPRFARRARAALLALPLLAACEGGAADPTTVTPPGEIAGTRLTCTADVRAGAVACAPAGTPAGARGRILGGQGVYIRMGSSNVAYAGGVFSFDATVQNLTDRPMGTSDGATRHAAGVRVFLTENPVVSGGTGTITVANATGVETFTASDQPYFQYGGAIGGVDQGELGVDGILAPSEVSTAKAWQFAVPATVTSFTFNVYASTETTAGAVSSVAPQVTAVSANPMVPGTAVTLTGYNFSATPASNVVMIGGRQATVTAATPTQLTVTVPCVASGNVAVQVTEGGRMGAPYTAPLQVAQRTLAVGQSVIMANASEVECNELAAPGTAAKYVMAVYNIGTTPTSSIGFQVSADDAAGARVVNPAAFAPAVAPALDFGDPAARLADRRHAELMAKNEAEGRRLAARFAGDRRMRTNVVSADPVEPPVTRSFRVSNINSASVCNNYYSVNATRVYYSGKIAIYEDDATPAGLRASANAAMQDYYNRIGDQFNADMEPIVRDNTGDILRRDASTDNNGVLVALFTPVINNNFPGVAGFVITCDLYPNDEGTTNTNRASNFGEYFYAYQPTVVGTGYNSFTPDSWYRSIRATFIHESKHVASNVARISNGAQTENAWLEEGTARHVEELWARTSIYNVAWKGNTGYGTAGSPNYIYCDVRPSTAACTASNPRRPSLNMQRHFSSLYNFLGSSATYSPFGASAADGSSTWYATSWSLVRFAVDRYGASDAAFLGGLTQAQERGTANLAARAGVPLAQVMGGWALSLYADDYPGIASPSADMQMPTWNFVNIYAGLKTDFPATYSRTTPIPATALSLGSVGTVSVGTLVGGGVSYFELSGTHTAPQLIRLRGTGGSALPANLRVAIARVE